MNIENTIRRAQVYGFLVEAFLYPEENWTQESTRLTDILHELNLNGFDIASCVLDITDWALSALQAEHRRVFGLTGSQCYETEIGLPHEFRQSQEMADIAGFYRAFGFNLGGQVRERPDHISAELEFMQVLAIKEAHAIERTFPEHVEICIAAQSKFLQDHLARWVGLFAESVAGLTREGPYTQVAQVAAAFVEADTRRLGLTIERQTLAGVKSTPLAPDLACGECPISSQDVVPVN